MRKKKIRGNKILKKTNLKKIFSDANIVCICVDLNFSTKHLIDKKILKYANKNISIINTSRGAIINENDLRIFLRDNPNSSALLDCFKSEPYFGPLLNLKNLYPLPHIASFTNETRKKMELSASKNLINYLNKIGK